MSFELYSESGYAGSLASIEGWADVSDALHEANKSKAFPTLYEFVGTGYTNHPARLAQEIAQFLVTVKADASVRDTLRNLKQSLSAVREIAIVSD